MRFTNRHLSTLASAGLLIGSWGCGDGGVTAPGPTGSTREAEVKGTVKVNGAALKQGKVIFQPANANRPEVGNRKADIGADGTYTIKTLVGQNSVLVEAPETAGDPRLYTPQSFDVQSGANTFDINLPPK